MIHPADPLEIAPHFRLAGRPCAAVRHPGGHINDSFVITCDEAGAWKRYVLQRINEHVFRDPSALMANVVRVLQHLQHADAPAPDARAVRTRLTLVETLDEAAFHRDACGGVWRMFHFVEGTRVHDGVSFAHQAHQAGLAFGRFQRLLAGLSPSTLVATIPDFHHTPRRLAALREAVGRDVLSRAAEARAEIDLAERFASLAEDLQGPLDRGVIPLRIAHNDAKITNVLFDADTDAALCVTDLDTVMPGSALHDFGDMIRTMTSPQREDSVAGGTAEVDLAWFAALAAGYLAQTASFLSSAEHALLVTAGLVITYEQAIRFLADHLDGDRYYRIERPGHNLARARAQFALLEALVRQKDRMEACLAGIRSRSPA